MARGPQPPLATAVTGPLGTKRTIPTQRKEFYDAAFRCGPYHTWDFFEDFDGRANAYSVTVPLILTSGNADTNKTPTTNTNVARAYLHVPRGGVITNIDYWGEDGITQDGTNYLTFTGLNLQAAGTGSTALLSTTAHVNTTDTNALAINGGTNLTAKVPYALTLAAAANLRVAGGDLLEITATATQSGAAVDAPNVRIRIAVLPETVSSQMQRTAGLPLVQVVANSLGGQAIVQLDATNEVEGSFITFGDQLVIDPSARPYFEARVKFGSAITTAQVAVVGLASAFTATLSSTTYNAWFRLAASMAVTLEGDDNTTDTDGQAAVPAVTLSASTWYRFSIDFSNLSAVEFRIDGNLCGTISVPLLTASTPLQPILGVQKASGTGTPSMTIDYIRVTSLRDN